MTLPVALHFFLNGLAVAAGFAETVHDRSLVGFEGGHDALTGQPWSRIQMVVDSE
jgi:hypothetical protein